MTYPADMSFFIKRVCSLSGNKCPTSPSPSPRPAARSALRLLKTLLRDRLSSDGVARWLTSKLSVRLRFSPGIVSFEDIPRITLNRTRPCKVISVLKRFYFLIIILCGSTQTSQNTINDVISVSTHYSVNVNR